MWAIKKTFLILCALAFAVNLIWAGVVLCQTEENAESNVNVIRLSSLSFFAIPANLDFGSVRTPSQKTAAFSDQGVDGTQETQLPEARRLTVQDTRDNGGFDVTLSANSDFTDQNSDTIPINNMRIVTTPLLQNVNGTTYEGVIYETDFTPDYHDNPVNAEVKTSAVDFGSESTFTAVNNNTLDTQTPVDVFHAPLSSSQGRSGRMSVGVAAMLYIPPFTAPGVYTTTMTWTLTDETT